MRIAKINIANFRSLRDFTIFPADGVNLLVGENNAGKTAFLLALNRALGRGGATDFDVEDFYVTSGATANSALPKITIDVELRPTATPTFSTNFTAEFVDDIDSDAEGLFLTLRTEARFDASEERIVVDYFSLRADGTTREMPPGRRSRVRGYVPFYLVDAFRDTIRDIQNRRGFWGRIVSSVNLDNATVSSVRTGIEGINASILAAAPRIAELVDRLREIGRTIRTVPPPDDVVINPLTLDPTNILRNLDVVVRTEDAPRGFGLERHGEGTRSVAHLAIFRAFVDLMAKEENDNIESTPVLGIEEPEVHLHPHATRSIAEVLATPTRQIFLTSHSPTLAQTVELEAIHLLRRTDTGTNATRVPAQSHGAPPQAFLEPQERAQLSRALRSGAADVFFSRVTLICEGETELHAFSYFAKACHIDVDRLGISLVSVDGCGSFYPLLKMMDGAALRIPWVVVADGDRIHDQVIQLIKLGRVTQALADSEEAAGTIEQNVLQPNDVFTLPNGYNFEEFLIRSSAAAEYEQAIVDYIGPSALRDFVAANSVLAAASIEDQLVAFMKTRGGRKWKVLFAEVVAEEITARGTNPGRLPALIPTILQRVADFATAAAVKTF